MADCKLRMRVVITNKRAIDHYFKGMGRLADLIETQAWNQELREIFDELYAAQKGLEIKQEHGRSGDNDGPGAA